MGLALVVGYLADMLENDEEGAQWFREKIDKLNPFLEASGLKPHVEPETCPVWSAEMYGYSGLHYLQRIAAHLNLRNSLPEPGGPDASRDPVVEEYCRLLGAEKNSFFGRLFRKKKIERQYDHLIFHSDAEGFYLPQDFREVLFPPEKLKIPGCMVGSSHRLLQETATLARAIELPLDMDPEAEAVWKAAETPGEGDLLWQQYGVESFICLRLYRAAKLSIKHSAVIVFT
jgi:hypothetical protein